MDNSTSFVSHLIELRKRLIYAFVAVFLLFLILIYWAPQIYNWFVMPLKHLLPKNSQIVFSDVTGAFLIPLKITFLVSLVIALPWVLYQLWAFVAPALYKQEKKLILPLVLSSYSLFLIGIAFVYFVVLPIIFQFLIGYSKATGTPMFTQANEYVSFVIQLFISFGIIFEIPIIVLLLVKIELIKWQTLVNMRPYIIVVAFVIAAILTPPDPLSQILMALPICLLFEIGLLISKKISK